jgi:hypothetical protein
MKYKLGVLFCLVFLFHQTPIHPEYDSVIRSEWRLAQDYLAMADDIGKRAYTVKPTCCVWEPNDGPFHGVTDYYEGMLEGYMYAKDGGDGEWKVHIKWNYNFPQVIRHEAAHYILWKLEHPCFAAVSLDGTTVNYHNFSGTEFDKDFREHCKWWVNKYWRKEDKK